MNVRRFFPPEALEAIHRATLAAEEKSGGEIVAYVVGRASDYHEACWKAAALGALLSAALAGLLHELGEVWGGWGLAWITLPVLLGLAAGYLLAQASYPLRCWLTPRATQLRRVSQRATQAFLEEQVFATVDRTGVLIFLALLERRALVLADQGIAARVAQQEWDALAGGLARGAGRGRAAEALQAAVEQAGDLLARYGVERRVDDRDELPSQPRLRDE
ncbi:MAG: hypothetical protein U0002_06450 [Thermoanaerobaculia bacterium]